MHRFGFETLRPHSRELPNSHRLLFGIVFFKQRDQNFGLSFYKES